MNRLPAWILIGAMGLASAVGRENRSLAAAGPNGQAEHRTVLGIQGTRFTHQRQADLSAGHQLLRRPGAPEAFLRRDLDDLQRHGFNWLRVWATCGLFDQDISVVDARGRPREPLLGKLRGIVAECDRRGLVVDVTLTRAKTTPGWGLPDLEAHQRAVEAVVTALKEYRNWYLDLANERDVRDERPDGVLTLKIGSFPSADYRIRQSKPIRGAAGWVYPQGRDPKMRSGGSTLRLFLP